MTTVHTTTEEMQQFANEFAIAELEEVLSEEYRNRTRKHKDTVYDQGARESEARFVFLLRRAITKLKGN